MMMSPCLSVPFWTRSVATGPRPRSRRASITVPCPARVGFAFNSAISAVSVTISSTFLNYGAMLTLISTNMHLFILKAVIDSFSIVPVNGLKVDSDIFYLYLKYMADYMIIAFRIVLPEFAAMLIVNTLLAILVKVAPQLSMFVIGFQLKIFVGITVLVLMMLMLPGISDMIFNNMIENMKNAIEYMGGS